MENSWPPGVIPLTKKEYKKLTEKAEKYDKLRESVSLIQHLNFEQFINEHEAIRDKIEAIKAYIEELKAETKVGLYQTSKQTIYRKLEEILEAEAE